MFAAADPAIPHAGASPHADAPPHHHVRATARERRLAEIGVLATVAIWSANFVVVKAAIGELGPFTFTSKYPSPTILSLMNSRRPLRSLQTLFLVVPQIQA